MEKMENVYLNQRATIILIAKWIRLFATQK